jgi:hypothetical protein
MALLEASVAFAEAEAELAGKLPAIIDVSAPYFANRLVRDQAHAALVEPPYFYRLRSE